MNFNHPLKTILLSSILVLSLGLWSGCGKEKNRGVEGPIEGWEDIALPEDAKWIRSTLSGTGKIENHEYSVNMIPEEFSIFLEEQMGLNGWTLTEVIGDTHNYMKYEDRVSIVVKPGSIKNESVIVIVIEPKGAFDAPKE